MYNICIVNLSEETKFFTDNHGLEALFRGMEKMDYQEANIDRQVIYKLAAIEAMPAFLIQDGKLLTTLAFGGTTIVPYEASGDYEWDGGHDMFHINEPIGKVTQQREALEEKLAFLPGVGAPTVGGWKRFGSYLRFKGHEKAM